MAHIAIDQTRAEPADFVLTRPNTREDTVAVMEHATADRYNHSFARMKFPLANWIVLVRMLFSSTALVLVVP